MLQTHKGNQLRAPTSTTTLRSTAEAQRRFLPLLLGVFIQPITRYSSQFLKKFFFLYWKDSLRSGSMAPQTTNSARRGTSGAFERTRRGLENGSEAEETPAESEGSGLQNTGGRHLRCASRSDSEESRAQSRADPDANQFLRRASTRAKQTSVETIEENFGAGHISSTHRRPEVDEFESDNRGDRDESQSDWGESQEVGSLGVSNPNSSRPNRQLRLEAVKIRRKVQENFWRLSELYLRKQPKKTGQDQSGLGDLEESEMNGTPGRLKRRGSSRAREQQRAMKIDAEGYSSDEEEEYNSELDSEYDDDDCGDGGDGGDYDDKNFKELASSRSRSHTRRRKRKSQHKSQSESRLRVQEPDNPLLRVFMWQARVVNHWISVVTESKQMRHIAEKRRAGKAELARMRNRFLESSQFIEMVDKAFEECDIDENGTIDRAELFAGVLLLYHQLNRIPWGGRKPPPRRKDVMNIMAKYDFNDDKRLDSEEFLALCQDLCDNVVLDVGKRVILVIFVFPLLAQPVQQVLVRLFQHLGLLAAATLMEGIPDQIFTSIVVALLVTALPYIEANLPAFQDFRWEAVAQVDENKNLETFKRQRQRKVISLRAARRGRERVSRLQSVSSDSDSA